MWAVGAASTRRVAGVSVDASQKRMQHLLYDIDLEEDGCRQELAGFSWLLAPVQ